MLSDLEIAYKSRLKPITDIALNLGLKKREFHPYGNYMGKVSLSAVDRLKDRKNGKYIVVTSITPTPLGEGKTVISIGLSMALNRIGRKSSVCLRQPSLGPVFGVKGGAAGGGYSQVLPMEDFNLNLTGDIHAVTDAHNLCSAFLDNSIFHGNRCNIDLDSITWKRVMDVSDRSLRRVRTGLGFKDKAFERSSGFDITAASEVMAILSLSENLADLRKRLGKIVLAFDRHGRPVTTEDIKAAGAMAVLLKDAIKPNLIQTIENTPCFVHTGPFGNIAHGNNSIISDRIALKLSDFVVTESGFGADCGGEKFFDIKCRLSGLVPDCAVIVFSVRALKFHSGKHKYSSFQDKKVWMKEDIPAVKKGAENLRRQINNVKLFGIPVAAVVNRFNFDHKKELDFAVKKALEFGADRAVVSDVWAGGSSGGIDLARAVVELAESRNKKFRFLYPLSMPIKKKIKVLSKDVYKAGKVTYTADAERKIGHLTRLGYGNLPVCMAKTHLSLSADPKLKGAPSGFTLPVRDVHASIGAGFLLPLCGKINTMPGLPEHPAGENIDIDSRGKIKGLF